MLASLEDKVKVTADRRVLANLLTAIGMTNNSGFCFPFFLIFFPFKNKLAILNLCK